MGLMKTPGRGEKKGPDLQALLADWPESFYRERSPLVRNAMLEEADRQGLTPEDNALRRRIFDRRYPVIREEEEEPADLFLRLMMELKVQAQNSSGLFGERFARRSALKLLQKTRIAELAEEGGRMRELLRQELCHLGVLYVTICGEDGNYRSLILGLGKMTDERLLEKIRGDLTEIAVTAPAKLKLEEEFAPLTESLLAVKEEYL